MKKSSEDWAKSYNIVMLKADGWDRKNFLKNWIKKISLAEFQFRLSLSTIILQK